MSAAFRNGVSGSWTDSETGGSFEMYNPATYSAR